MQQPPRVKVIQLPLKSLFKFQPRENESSHALFLESYEKKTLRCAGRQKKMGTASIFQRAKISPVIKSCRAYIAAGAR